MAEEPGDTCVKRLTLGQHLRLRNAAGCTVQCCVGMLWITQEIRALNRVVHVPVPLILGCIGKGRRNPTLRRHGMRAGWEYLGKHSHFQIRARELERRAHTGAPATDDERVKFADRKRDGYLLQRPDDVLNALIGSFDISRSHHDYRERFTHSAIAAASA